MHILDESDEEQVVVAAGAGLRAVRAASELSRQLNGEAEAAGESRSGSGAGRGRSGGGADRGLTGAMGEMDEMEAELARLQAEQDRLQREGDDLGAEFSDRRAEFDDGGIGPREIAGQGRRLVHADGDLATWLCRLADTAREVGEGFTVTTPMHAPTGNVPTHPNSHPPAQPRTCA